MQKTNKSRRERNESRRVRGLGDGAAAFGRQSRTLQHNIADCITFTCFRRLIHSICKVLSTSEIGPLHGVKRTRYSASRNFVRKLRLLLANECYAICQVAASEHKHTLTEADVVEAIRRYAKPPSLAVDHLVQAVADVDSQARERAASEFYKLDWCTQVSLERFSYNDPSKLSNDILAAQVHRPTETQRPLQMAAYRQGKPEHTAPPTNPIPSTQLLNFYMEEDMEFA